MSASRDMVREFHRAFAVVDEERPSLPPVARPGESLNFRVNGRYCLTRALAEFKSAARAGDVRAHRLALITEELAELASAFEGFGDHDVSDALDALCDLQYVLDGTVLACGMDRVADEAFRRVHASNMSKLGADGKPVLNEHGKVTKGPNYVPVQLEDLVR